MRVKNEEDEKEGTETARGVRDQFRSVDGERRLSG